MMRLIIDNNKDIKFDEVDNDDKVDNDDDIDDDEAGPRMVSIGSLQRRQTAAGLKITRTTKKGQKYQLTKMEKIKKNKKKKQKERTLKTDQYK